MRKRYYRKKEGDGEFEFIFGISVLLTMFVWYVYTYKNAEFWHVLKYYIAPASILAIAGFVFLLKRSAKRNTYVENISMALISSDDSRAIVDKFLLTFGKSKSKFAWKHREYAFETEYLHDFTDTLIEKGFDISQRDNEDIKKILAGYIDIKDKNFLNQTLELKQNHSFDEFKNDGIDFENLIVRLYTAMGYESKRIGGSGDQGGDVITAKNGQSILIQAKFYEGSVSNEAVQQASAARLHYGCSNAQVITTGVFTKGAIELARSTNVELIDKHELQKLLATHLGEVWQ